MKTLILIFLILFQVSILSASSLTDSIMTVDSTKIEHKNNYAGNNIYLDAGIFIFVHYYNFNYERLITNKMSLRICYGSSGHNGGVGGGGKEAENISLLGNVLIFDGESKFDFGLGISYIWLHSISQTNNVKYDFAFTCGYRFQPSAGGFFFRAGLSRFSPGGGLNMSLGFTF
ncbi:MAG: hypothetical protein HZB41_09785 [Ignavibacteriae bacterium]|nr:hypothetical protein [Ignavibacteriota bacterium]